MCVLSRIVIQNFTNPGLPADYTGTKACDVIVAPPPPNRPSRGVAPGPTGPTAGDETAQGPGRPWQLNAVSDSPDVLVKCRAYCF